MNENDSLMTIIFIILIAFGCVAYSSCSCHEQGAMMKKRANFSLVSGCMVEHKPGEWIPVQQYRVIE